MHRMKLAGILVALLCASILAGCGGAKDYEEPYPEEDFENAETNEFNVEFAEEHAEKPANVSVDYLDDVLDRDPDYDTVVLFHTDQDVEDFRVFAMNMSINDNGEPSYDPEEVFRAPELKEDTPIAVPLNFPGDFSLNGFCYKESDGEFKTFTISQSGMDGSLVINPESFTVP